MNKIAKKLSIILMLLLSGQVEAGLSRVKMPPEFRAIQGAVNTAGCETKSPSVVLSGEKVWNEGDWLYTEGDTHLTLTTAFEDGQFTCMDGLRNISDSVRLCILAHDANGRLLICNKKKE